MAASATAMSMASVVTTLALYRGSPISCPDSVRTIGQIRECSG